MSHSVQASTTLLKSLDFTSCSSPRRGVRQVEKPREGIAQIEAAAAAVANVEDAAQFRVELLFVVEIGVLPVHRMADRRLQTAFRHDERRSFGAGGWESGAREIRGARAACHPICAIPDPVDCFSERPPHPVLLPASSPWRAGISAWPHPQADAAGRRDPRIPLRTVRGFLLPSGRETE